MAITYSIIDNAIPESAVFARQTLMRVMEGDDGSFPAWNDPAPAWVVDMFAPYLREA